MLCLTTGASGVIIAFDNFEGYDLGELSTGNNDSGLGWGGGWSANAGVTEIVDLGNALNFQINGGALIDGGARALQISGNNDFAVFRDFALPQSGDIYLAFLFYAEPGSVLAGNDFVSIWLGEGSYIGVPSIGLKADQGPGGQDLMGRVTGNEEAYVGEMNVAQPYYLVGRLTKEGGSSTYNRYDIWLNPGVGDELTPDAVSTGSITYSEFERLGVRSVNLDIGDSLLIDFYIVATDWADVVPVPEPRLLALLLGLGSFAFVILKRRLIEK